MHAGGIAPAPLDTHYLRAGQRTPPKLVFSSLVLQVPLAIMHFHVSDLQHYSRGKTAE